MFNKLTRALIESENLEAKEKELPKSVDVAMNIDNINRFCPKFDECPDKALAISIISATDKELSEMPVEMQVEKLYNDAKASITNE